MEDGTFLLANEMMYAINRMGLYCSWRDRMKLKNKENTFDLIITDSPHDPATAIPVLHSVTEKEFLAGLSTLNHFISLQNK